MQPESLLRWSFPFLSPPLPHGPREPVCVASQQEQLCGSVVWGSGGQEKAKSLGLELPWDCLPAEEGTVSSFNGEIIASLNVDSMLNNCN